MKKILFWILVLGIIITLVIIVVNKKNQEIVNISSNESGNTLDSVDELEIPLKEFSMTSFVEMVDGEPKPQFSLKEITVNKGDMVRLKITVTSGMHDFKIDELGVYEDTQPGIESVVEFIASEAGEFVYYCTQPGHRQNGHWGILKVLE